MKILLVEDHATLADISCRVLREIYDHTVELAGTGAQALEAAPRFMPDLMLIDLGLPDITGYEVAARIRRDPQFEHTILVALTGIGNLVDHAHADAVGFDARYTKPMDFTVLGSLIRRRPVPRDEIDPTPSPPRNT